MDVGTRAAGEFQYLLSFSSCSLEQKSHLPSLAQQVSCTLTAYMPTYDSVAMHGFWSSASRMMRMHFEEVENVELISSRLLGVAGLSEAPVA